MKTCYQLEDGKIIEWFNIWYRMERTCGGEVWTFTRCSGHKRRRRVQALAEKLAWRKIFREFPLRGQCAVLHKHIVRGNLKLVIVGEYLDG